MTDSFLSRFFIRYIPMHLYRKLKSIAYIPADLLGSIRGKKDRLVPPLSKAVFYGVDPEFKVIGAQFLKFFIELGGLKPGDKVLDVGCGIGRIALALAQYISREGEYQGFDIINDGIRWCARNITPKFPNFHFQAVEV